MSEHKSSEMEYIAKQHDWRTQIKPEFPDDFDSNPDARLIKWNLYALRGAETLHIQWTGDLQTSAKYTCGEYVLTPARKAGVIKLLTSVPDLEKIARAAKSTMSIDELLESRNIPWESGSPALDILKSVIGKTIRWVRRFDGEICEADVRVNLSDPITRQHFKICEHANGRNLEWVDNHGFHAIALEQIVDVS
jgi:hypothetical protein